MKSYLYLLFFSVLFLACDPQPSEKVSNQDPKQGLSPDERYGELFEKTQMAHFYPDSKTFADARPKSLTSDLLSAYEAQKDEEGFDLKNFIENNKLPRNLFRHGL